MLYKITLPTSTCFIDSLFDDLDNLFTKNSFISSINTNLKYKCLCPSTLNFEHKFTANVGFLNLFIKK